MNEINTMSHSFTLAAQKSTTDVPMCSHWEATQGLSMDYTVTVIMYFKNLGLVMHSSS